MEQTHRIVSSREDNMSSVSRGVFESRGIKKIVVGPCRFHVRTLDLSQLVCEGGPHYLTSLTVRVSVN